MSYLTKASYTLDTPVVVNTLVAGSYSVKTELTR